MYQGQNCSICAQNWDDVTRICCSDASPRECWDFWTDAPLQYVRLDPASCRWDKSMQHVFKRVGNSTGSRMFSGILTHDVCLEGVLVLWFYELCYGLCIYNHSCLFLVYLLFLSSFPFGWQKMTQHDVFTFLPLVIRVNPFGSCNSFTSISYLLKQYFCCKLSQLSLFLTLNLIDVHAIHHWYTTTTRPVTTNDSSSWDSGSLTTTTRSTCTVNCWPVTKTLIPG